MKTFTKFVKSLLISEGSLYLVCLFICFGIFMVNFSHLPPQIPLFYSHLTSERQITDLIYIWSLPIISLLIMIINQLVAKIIFKNNLFVKKTVHIVNVATILLLAFIFIKIITLVA